MTQGVPVDSAYAAQLREGTRQLRFQRALEAEFHKQFVEQHVRRTRIGFAVAIGLYAVYLLLKLRVDAGLVREYGAILRATIIGAISLALVGTFFERLRRIQPFLTATGYCVFAAGVTALEVIARRYGADHHYEGLIIGSFHVYLFSGLMFRPALVVGGAMLAIYTIGGLAFGLASHDFGFQVFFTTLTHIIGASALYTLERVERDGFLRRGWLGELATQDGLTHLLNRMAFLQQLDLRLRHAAREGRAIGVVLLDIDHFKAYNDTYGHLEGDGCLRAVAQALQGEFKRGLDMVGRYGGEEFVGFWYDLDPQQLRPMADQLRGSVQALRIAHSGSPHGRVTISVGAVALVPREDQSTRELLHKADEALYQAKEKGRNRAITLVLPSAHTASARGRRAPTVTG